MLRGRVISTTYEYDDQGRISRTYADPAWTADDHDLMLAVAEYEASLCPGCGQPKDHAWHSESEGWYDDVEFTCQSCIKIHGPSGAVYKMTHDTWPASKPRPETPFAPSTSAGPTPAPA